MPTEMEILHAEVAALRGEVRRKHRYGRLLPVAILALFVALLPGLAIAANPFNDLVSGSPHNGNIDAIYNAGITTGCVPNQSYCPTDLVTRQEMASFLARTAGLGNNAPVANAKTAQTAALATNATNATHATSADTAITATTLNGFAANGLSRVGAQSSQSAVFTVGSSYQAITVVTIVVPGPGFVTVSGALTLQQTFSGVAIVSTFVGDNQTGFGSYPLLASIGSSAGYAYEASVSPITVFPVPSAGSYTYSLVTGRNSASTGTTQAEYGTIVAAYSPFGAGGAQGAEQENVNTRNTAPVETQR